MLNRELTQLSETSRSGNQVSEFISNTFLGGWVMPVLACSGCVMACLFLSPVSKNLSERRSTKSDMSPVSLRSALPSGKSQNRVSQVLQVPPVSLYPLRKKSLAKDLAHSESCPPQSGYSCWSEIR